VKRGLQMRNQNTLLKLSGARIVASVFGILAGLGGIIHGIGEVLQGNVEPGGITIQSWTHCPGLKEVGHD
jgi:hypothetical protein